MLHDYGAQTRNSSYGDRMIHMRDGEIVSPEKISPCDWAKINPQCGPFAHHLETSSVDDLKKPILPGKGASDYERYLRTELLSLQKLLKSFCIKTR